MSLPGMDYFSFASQFLKFISVPNFSDPYVDIHVRSEGCEDPGKAPNTCGIAYINVDGREYSLRHRGHNVVIVDAETGNTYIFIES